MQHRLQDLRRQRLEIARQRPKRPLIPRPIRRIHAVSRRLDRPLQERPWRAPTWVLSVGAVLSFVNLAFMGFGADVYGVGTLSTGLVFCALIIPVFFYRHYLQDKGHFPEEMKEDLGHNSGASQVKRAGIWPYLVLAAGVAVVVITHQLAVY